MDHKLATLLVEILQEDGEEASLYEGYSGRGMFGKETTGVVCDNLALLLTAVVANAHMFVEGDYSMFEDIKTIQYDSLGSQIIVY